MEAITHKRLSKVDTTSFKALENSELSITKEKYKLKERIAIVLSHWRKVHYRLEIDQNWGVVGKQESFVPLGVKCRRNIQEK